MSVAPAHARIVEIAGPPTGRDLEDLVDVLVATVNGGASVGFLPPLDPAEARRFWEGIGGEDVVLLLARDDSGRAVGTVHLKLATRPNALHRAEVSKLLVHPDARRRGVGRQLMLAAHVAAQRYHRSLLVLDTREGDPSNDLYRALGYQEAGRIPRFARSGEGTLDTTVVYYLDL